MIEAYGTALVELKCKAAGGEKVDLGQKMIRPQHVGALFAAVERYKVAELDLDNNQLGATGGALLAAALKTNITLTTLRCAQLGRPSNQGQGLAVLLGGPTLAALALLTLPSPCAQAQRQQPRPRGWHGARRGPEEQHHPQGAPVCCPAIKPTRPCLTALQHARSLHWPFSPCLRRVRRLSLNDLGPEAGMAFAEALKSNTTLETLRSAALPSNPPAHASRSFTANHASVCVAPFLFP